LRFPEHKYSVSINYRVDRRWFTLVSSNFRIAAAKINVTEVETKYFSRRFFNYERKKHDSNIFHFFTFAVANYSQIYPCVLCLINLCWRFYVSGLMQVDMTFKAIKIRSSNFVKKFMQKIDCICVSNFEKFITALNFWPFGGFSSFDVQIW
jgi:hypothetical protein